MSGILSKFRLDGKVALVTGGGKGIGKSICLTYAEAGADVVLAEIDKNAGEAIASQITAMGRKALFLPTDVTKEEQVIKMAETAKKEFKHIDILVNNVGGPIFGPRNPGDTTSSRPISTVINMSTELWNVHILWNLTDTFWCCREVGRIMAVQNSGNIINIASVAGNRAVPGMAAYGAPKAAVIHLSQILALELRRYHIRVNCITPMNIRHSDQTWGGPFELSEEESAKRAGISVHRMGTLEDTSALALFLASEASSYITGLTIDVAGGPLFPNDIMERFESQPPVI